MYFFTFAPMKKLGVIQEYLGSMLLSFRTKWNDRKPKVFTFDNAKSIGIVYDAPNKTFIKKVTDYAETLIQEHPDMQITTLGFLPKAENFALTHQQINEEFFTANDFTWSGRLQKSCASEFVKKEFNILIDLTTDTSYPIQYVVLASAASYKIGRYVKDLRYDLMIDTKNENTIEYLITQINVYLAQIKVN